MRQIKEASQTQIVGPTERWRQRGQQYFDGRRVGFGQGLAQSPRQVLTALQYAQRL